MSGMSPAKFAIAVGMQVDAVYKAAADGRLGGAVRKQGRRIFIDLEKGREAMKGWRRTDEPSPPPRPPGEVRDLGETYQGEGLEESAAVEKFWKAKLAELQFKKAAEQLVVVDDVQQRYASEVTACRTKLLAVVPRLRQRVTLDDATFALIDDLIRESLAELGRSQGAQEESAEANEGNG
jgi:hypothetical protein